MVVVLTNQLNFARQGKDVTFSPCFVFCVFRLPLQLQKRLATTAEAQCFFNDIRYILHSVNLGSVAMVTYI